jgi:isocitrate dehydrogenase (NAD+)
MLGFSVIHRPVATIPGVPSNFRKKLDLDIIRVARGGTYDDPGCTVGSDAAVSLRIVERTPCREAAYYAFALARKTGKSVTSTSKHTIQRATDGLFESVVDEVAAEFPDVVAREELFDALLAKIILCPERYQIVLALNEYGDFLSDMACGLVGSMGIGASASLAFDGPNRIRYGLFDPAGGTAPDIAGQNKANPTAIFLALAMLFDQLGEAELAGAIRASTFDLLRGGITTPDLGGDRSTSQFAEAVASEVARRSAPAYV